jgi:hypothetical protein
VLGWVLWDHYYLSGPPVLCSNCCCRSSPLHASLVTQPIRSFVLPPGCASTLLFNAPAAGVQWQGRELPAAGWEVQGHVLLHRCVIEWRVAPAGPAGCGAGAAC